MTNNFQNAIMQDDLTNMRLTRSAKARVVESIQMKMRFLYDLDVATTDQLTKGPLRPAPVQFSSASGPGPSSPAEGSSKRGQASASTAKAPALPTVAATEDITNLPNHRILFIGRDYSRLRSTWGENGRLWFGKLTSTPPEDFHYDMGGLYFSNDRQTAWEYCEFAARVLADGLTVPVGILEVAVPNDLFASRFDLHGDTWKKIVWCSRRDADYPEDLEELHENFQWLTGRICKQSTPAINEMSVTDINQLEGFTLKTGDKAYQWWTNKYAMYRLLSERCVDKINLYQVTVASGSWKLEGLGLDIYIPHALREG